ncbi:hypothetical protein [Thermoclostridium stercorarium]|uniref:hypothetical protein n=1 Tax=Thermoclostridium stercorarium TaxID=1510 RepID=UPI000A477499|nr:hypothetical protein [Thermoclostridium stercorarium]
MLTRDAKRAQLKDNTLLNDIPANTKIYRTAAWDFSEWPFPLNLAGKYIRRRILIPDGERLWEVFSYKKAMEIIKEEKVDLIYSTSQPFSTHLLAMKLKQTCLIFRGFRISGMNGRIMPLLKRTITGHTE